MEKKRAVSEGSRSWNLISFPLCFLCCFTKFTSPEGEETLDNPKHPYFYLVGLEAVSVGGRRIAAAPNLRRVDREGNGGTVVDSGTTFTLLPEKTYARIVEEFDRRMVGSGRVRAVETEAETGLRPCYYESSSSNNSSFGVPSLVLHFAGNAGVALPRRN